MNEQNLRGLLALRDVKGLGSKRIADLLEAFESVDQIFEAEFEAFSDLGFVNEKVYGQIQETSQNASKYDDVISECRAADIEVVSLLDTEFPDQLRREKVAPLLFSKGNWSLFNKPCISIVGSRESSNESIDWAFDVAKNLSQKGYVIVSGGARGIDTAAHKGALAGSGETICVLGSGISNVYPPENEELVAEIARSGLVVSHRSPTQNVNRYSLLDRNEITSGIGSCLVIVSSSGEGGTASQYEDALSQGKQILCPKPSIGLEPSEGTKEILEEGHADVVSNAADIQDFCDSRSRQASLDELGGL